MSDLKSASLGGKVLMFPEPGGNARISGDMAKNMMWIELKFKKFTSLTGNIWENGGFGTTDSRGNKTMVEGPTLMFIAPMELQETFTHQWDDASNIAGRALTAWTGFSKTLSDANSLVNTITSQGNLLMDRMKPGENSGTKEAEDELQKSNEAQKSFHKEYESKINRAAKDYRKESFYKYDAPQQYKESPKPSYNFMFSLGDSSDPEYDILLPVQMLRYLSAASKPSIGHGSRERDLIKMEFPYVCEVNTVWGNSSVPIINMKFAAITSLQFSFGGPYRNGIPTKADITITLSSILPVYRSTVGGFDSTVANQNIVTISNKAKTVNPYSKLVTPKEKSSDLTINPASKLVKPKHKV
jgi:hypothetical protein